MVYINRIRFRSRQPLMMQLAWLLPKRLVYFAAIRVIAHATTGQYGSTNPTHLPAMQALKRWTRDHNVQE